MFATLLQSLRWSQTLKAQCITAVIAVAVALVLIGWLPKTIFMAVLVFVGLLHAYGQNYRPWLHHSVWFVAFVLGVFIGVWRPDGFNYPLVFSVDSLHEGGEAFSLYANLGKGLAGYCALLLLLEVGRSSEQRSLRPLQNLAVVLIIPGAVILAGLFAGLNWVPKWTPLLFIFTLVNLLITCVAEETFLRLFLQRHIARMFSQPWMGRICSVGAATLVFWLTHFHPHLPFNVVFLLAGFGYALAYAISGRLSIAIAVHFMVNFLHFSLLEYPVPML